MYVYISLPFNINSKKVLINSVEENDIKFMLRFFSNKLLHYLVQTCNKIHFVQKFVNCGIFYAFIHSREVKIADGE